MTLLACWAGVVVRIWSFTCFYPSPGHLERKQEAGCGGKRATVRSWRAYYAVLCGQLLCFFRDEIDFANAKAAAPPVAILNVSF